jgi:tetratricopeptide (TPR) repeat protein
MTVPPAGNAQHADLDAAIRPAPLPPSLEWVGALDGELHALDQSLLPHERVILRLRTAEDVADAILRLAIRGAPIIGVAAAYGLYLGVRAIAPEGPAALDTARHVAAMLLATRPTAVNLRWALDRCLSRMRKDHDVSSLLAEAARIDPNAEDAKQKVIDANADADKSLMESRKLLLALLDRGEVPRLCHFHLLQIAAVTRDSAGMLEHGEKYLEAAAADQKKTQDEIDRTTIWGYEQFRKSSLQILRGDEIGVRTLLAQHLYERGEFEKALAHVDAVLAIDPRRSDERYNRGLILKKLGRNDEAKDDMRTFLATTTLPPDSAKVQEAVEALRQ